MIINYKPYKKFLQEKKILFVLNRIKSRDNRDRTYDITDMSRVLYQLSYIPMQCLNSI